MKMRRRSGADHTGKIARRAGSGDQHDLHGAQQIRVFQPNAAAEGHQANLRDLRAQHPCADQVRKFMQRQREGRGRDHGAQAQQTRQNGHTKRDHRDHKLYTERGKTDHSPNNSAGSALSPPRRSSKYTSRSAVPILSPRETAAPA